MVAVVRLCSGVGGLVEEFALCVEVKIINFVNDLWSDGPPYVCVVEEFGGEEGVGDLCFGC